MDRNWIEVIGRRETVGHPELFATTRQFLLDLGLNSLQELPSIGPRDEAPQEDFELFDGQTEELALEAAPAADYLAAIDAEHSKLEDMALPLMKAIENEQLQKKDEDNPSLSLEEQSDENNHG